MWWWLLGIVVVCLLVGYGLAFSGQSLRHSDRDIHEQARNTERFMTGGTDV